MVRNPSKIGIKRLNPTCHPPNRGNVCFDNAGIAPPVIRVEDKIRKMPAASDRNELILGPSLSIKAFQFRPRRKRQLSCLIETYTGPVVMVTSSTKGRSGNIPYAHRVFEDSPGNLDGILRSNEVGFCQV